MMFNEKTKSFFYNLVAILFSFIAILPFVWMISTSLKSNGALLALPIQWIPRHPTMYSFSRLFQNEGILLSMLNSIIVTAGAIVIGLISSSMAAFAFAKIKFRGSSLLFTIILASMMIPAQVIFIPLYLIMNELNLTNTLASLIILYMFQAFAIFMLRQQMMAISDSYMDAAAIDGASLLKTFFLVILPMCKTALATLAIIIGMGAWNDYLLPLVLLTTKDRFTLPIILNALNGQFATSYNLLMAGSLVTMLPLLVLYIAAQKYFAKGLQVGGIKG